jgi:hypothetical protein
MIRRSLLYIIHSSIILVLATMLTLMISEDARAAGAPTAPQNIQFRAEDNHIVLTWDVVPEATSYNIYRSTTSGQQESIPYASKVIPVVLSKNVRSFTNTKVDFNTVYYYQISALNEFGEGSRSKEIRASANPALIATPVPTSAPTQQKSTQNSTNSFLSSSILIPLIFAILALIAIIAGILMGLGAIRSHHRNSKSLEIDELTLSKTKPISAKHNSLLNGKTEPHSTADVENIVRRWKDLSAEERAGLPIFPEGDNSSRATIEPDPSDPRIGASPWQHPDLDLSESQKRRHWKYPKRTLWPPRI